MSGSWSRVVTVLTIVLVGSTACGRSTTAADRSRAVTTTGAPATTASPATGPTTQTYDPYAGTRPAVAPAGTVTDGTVRTADGRDRRYRLFVPAALPTSTRAPLLVALHGGLGSSAQFAANTGFDGLAEANGFVVVYPDGIGAASDGSGGQTWNGGSCCGAAARLGVDDVGFVRQLLDALERDLAVDPARIFVAGHSNGAILAYRLACELSDRIAAIGVQAGSLEIDGCAPSRPVAAFHLHGGADTNLPIAGGRGTGVAGVAFRPAREAVDALTGADGCAPVPVPGVDPTNPDVTVTTWTPCRSGTEVRFVVVAGATHAWMGHAGASPVAARLVGEPYPGLDASRAIWSVLAAHPRR